MHCPALPLLACRRSGKPNNPTAWTLIFPSSWAMALWVHLAFQGAAPAGQQEWHWTALQCGEAFFPHDFPDTRSAAEFELVLRAEEAAERKLRPKGRFPEPTVVDWEAVGNHVSNASPSTGEAHAAIEISKV